MKLFNWQKIWILKKKKKKLLKINTAQFDPLGLISPMSMYRQEYKSNWNDELNDIIKQKFLKVLNDLKNIKLISMKIFIYGYFKKENVILN